MDSFRELDFKIPFQSDEIQRHGPPLAFSEDVFEKRHGVIRAKLFHQENQLARSRDTALIFGKSYIFLHIIMGGFFQTNGIWYAFRNTCTCNISFDRDVNLLCYFCMINYARYIS